MTIAYDSQESPDEVAPHAAFHQLLHAGPYLLRQSLHGVRWALAHISKCLPAHVTLGVQHVLQTIFLKRARESRRISKWAWGETAATLDALYKILRCSAVIPDTGVRDSDHKGGEILGEVRKK